MQNLIRSLLDYSRMNITEIKFEPIDLNVMVEEIKQELLEKITEKEALITSEHLPSIKVIPVQFQQLFLILSRTL